MAVRVKVCAYTHTCIRMWGTHGAQGKGKPLSPKAHLCQCFSRDHVETPPWLTVDLNSHRRRTLVCGRRGREDVEPRLWAEIVHKCAWHTLGTAG